MADKEPSSAAWTAELLADPHGVADKRARVRRMFAGIAKSYDLNNRVHSLWMDQRWRRRAVRLAEVKAEDVVVDVACGTGDLALAFNDALWVAEDQCHTLPDPNQVLGIDFTASMLEIAQEKARKRRLPREFSTMTPGESVPEYASESVSFVCGDAMRLPLADGSADVVSIAFGIRNVTDAGAAMREFYRVLRPGGRVIVLEFSLPENRVLRGLYNFYFRKVLPRTATWISGDKSGAYQYLPESVNTFIGRDRMMGMMREAGFGDVRGFPLTFGVCVCYRGVK